MIHYFHPIGILFSLFPLSLSHNFTISLTLLEWCEAIKAELDAIDLNRTWAVVPLPEGKHAIGCRWIYKIKYRFDGSVDQHKARLVTKGYTQQGMDLSKPFLQSENWLQ